MMVERKDGEEKVRTKMWLISFTRNAWVSNNICISVFFFVFVVHTGGDGRVREEWTFLWSEKYFWLQDTRACIHISCSIYLVLLDIKIEVFLSFLLACLPLLHQLVTLSQFFAYIRDSSYSILKKEGCVRRVHIHWHTHARIDVYPIFRSLPFLSHSCVRWVSRHVCSEELMM